MKRPTATNFFERQESARKRTYLLVFLFILGVLAVGVAIWPVIAVCSALCIWAGAIFALFEDASGETTEGMAKLGGDILTELTLNSDATIVAAIIGGFVICVATVYKICDLKSRGACGVAEKLGGTRIDRSAQNLDEKRFYNVVEEMALACGVPVPAVYVLRDEDGINACAIGGKLENSAIAATAGALRLLTRDELQGVVAHEFAHLVNGDVKINMRLIGVLFGLQALSIIGLACLKAESKQRGRKKATLAPVWFALIILGTVGVFVGGMIRAAISRQREMAADASSALFTRNPAGLAGALKKIGGLRQGSIVSASASAEMAHLFFGSVLTGVGERLFRTHPDLTERILALEPTFDGVFPKIVDETLLSKMDAERKAAKTNEAESRRVSGRKERESTANATPPAFDGVLSALAATLGEDGDEVRRGPLASIGTLTPRKLRVAAELLGQTPPEIETFLTDFDGARAVLFALLLDRDDAAVRRVQLETIRRSEVGNVAASEFEARVERAERLLAGLSFSVRSAVARLAAPTLKSGTLDDYKRFRETVFALCDADGRRDLFEFALQASVIRGGDVWFGLTAAPTARFSTFESVREPFRTVLSFLAFEGAFGSATAAARAFEAGVSALGDVAKSEEALVPTAAEERTFDAFRRAADALAQTTPLLKEKLLTAFFACVAADGRIVYREGELIDALTAALGVPAPIWNDPDLATRLANVAS